MAAETVAEEMAENVTEEVAETEIFPMMVAERQRPRGGQEEGTRASILWPIRVPPSRKL